MFGPAWLAMMADLDASSIIGAAQVGSTFGYGFVWVMILLIAPLYLVMEVAGRVGAVTRKGLGELVRERFGKEVALLVALPMFLTDLVTYVAEYLGIAVGLEVMGVPLTLGLAIAYMLQIAIYWSGKYHIAEKVLVKVSLVFGLALLLSLLLRGVKPYSPFYFEASPDFFFLLASTVGAVIMPFMLFFQPSATAEKMANLKCLSVKSAVRHYSRETLFGAVVTQLGMVIVEMTFTGVSVNSGTFASGSELAKALTPVAGPLSPYLFGVGLIGAAFLALVVVSLGSTWGVVEALGLEREKGRLLYFVESLPAVIVVLLLPSGYLMDYVLFLLALFAVIVIAPLVLLGLLARDERLMGEFRLKGLRELMYWSSTALIVYLGLLGLFA